jgi:hypothetical protein
MIRCAAQSFALLTLVVILVSNARADSGSTDETLKKLFPDRDLSKAAIKIFDRASGTYIVGDKVEIAKDGSIHLTNAAIVQVIRNGPNEPPGRCSLAGERMVLQFKTPIKMLSDMGGNKLTSATNGTGVGFRIADK